MVKSKRKMKNIYFLIFIFITNQTNGQLIYFSKANPYRAVFAETDAFDSSYLTVLANAYAKAFPDTIKLAIGNDLAYYWHTRNLDKA